MSVKGKCVMHEYDPAKILWWCWGGWFVVSLEAFAQATAKPASKERKRNISYDPTILPDNREV